MPPTEDPLPPVPSSDEARLRAQRFESLGVLAGQTAHDVNNVLGVVLGYVELARMLLGDEHPKAGAHLERALATVGRVRALSDAVLAAARPEARPPDVAAPWPVLEATTQLLARTLDPRVELALDAPEDLPCTALDEEGLRQVLLNLCLQAARGMPAGGRIQIAARREEHPGDDHLPAGSYVRLTVTDDGPGVPEEVRAALLAPWPAARPIDPSGLGLWAARTWVERHGGRLAAGTGPQRAGFEAWLPHAVSAAAAPPPAARPGRGDVLVVDADADARAVLRAYLERDGHAVREADSLAAAGALLAAEAEPVGTLLVDALLPDGDGADLARRVAAQPGGPRVVLMTGAPEPGPTPPGVHVLPRPFLHADLTHALEGAPGRASG